MIKKILKILSEEKSLLKNSISILSSTAIGGIFSAATTVLLARIFAPHDFGIFKTLTSFYGFFIYFFDFGFQNTLIKYISQYKANGEYEKIRHLIQNLFFFRLLILLPIIVGSLIFKDEIARTFLGNKNLSYLIYPGIIFAIITFSDITRPIIIGMQNFRLISFINIIVPLAGLLILIPTAVYLGLPYAIIAAGIIYLIGSVISIAFLIKIGLHFRAKISLIRWPNLIISYGLPSYFSALPSYIFLAIIPFLSLFFNQTIIGYYAFSLSFYTLAMIIPVSISQILFPKISSLAAKNRKKALQTFKNVIFLYTFVAILEIIMIILFTKTFVSIFSPNFLPAVSLVIILVSTAAMLGIFTLLIAYFTARHKLKIAFALNIILALIFVFVSFAAIKLTFR